MVAGRVGRRGTLAVKSADQECENAQERAQNRHPATAVNTVWDYHENRKLVTHTIVLVRM